MIAQIVRFAASRRSELRMGLLGTIAIALLVPTPSSYAQQSTPQKTQSAHHAKKSPPKPEPTLSELVEYLRGKLLSLSPRDGINDNLDVLFDPLTNVFSIVQPDGRCDYTLSALDANSLVWDTYNPSDDHTMHEELQRLTVASSSGKTARVCYNRQKQPDPNILGNRARFFFSLSLMQQIPGVQQDIAKAVRKLIAATGGAAENKLF